MDAFVSHNAFAVSTTFFWQSLASYQSSLPPLSQGKTGSMEYEYGRSLFDGNLSSAVFSIIQSVRLRPLTRPDRIYLVRPAPRLGVWDWSVQGINKRDRLTSTAVDCQGCTKMSSSEIPRRWGL